MHEEHSHATFDEDSACWRQCLFWFTVALAFQPANLNIVPAPGYAVAVAWRGESRGSGRRSERLRVDTLKLEYALFCNVFGQAYGCLLMFQNPST
jgi:hypothetical protein